MLLLKMGPEVPSRARRALPSVCRSEKEDGRRPSEFLVNKMYFGILDILRSQWHISKVIFIQFDLLH